METPLVSVLLASYNHEAYVEAAIRSILSQQGVSFELIVIDDGSTDQSPLILESLSKKLGFQFITRPNQGFVSTMNELAKLARGRYFCSFASDDIMPAGRLMIQSTFMEEHPNVPVCFGQTMEMNASGTLELNLDERFLKGVPEVTFEELFLGQKALHGCTEMIRRDLFFEVGGYDSRFFFEDFPLWLRLSYQYGPLPVLENVFCYYRLHGNNMHLNHEKMYSELLRVIDLYSEHPLYKRAVWHCKSNWFSSLTYSNKMKALQMFFKLASPSWMFLRRVPKLFIPRRFLKY